MSPKNVTLTIMGEKTETKNFTEEDLLDEDDDWSNEKEVAAGMLGKKVVGVAFHTMPPESTRTDPECEKFKKDCIKCGGIYEGCGEQPFIAVITFDDGSIVTFLDGTVGTQVT